VQTRIKSERLRATPLKLEEKRMGDPNNRFDLATLCHDSCESYNNSERVEHNVAARIAPLNALQVKRMLDIRAYARAIKER
jgi:hypothetical protein